MAFEIQRLAADYGLQRLGFLTLTFRDRVTDMREASRRFNSLNTHVIRGRYRRAIGVWERQASGRLHLHLVVVLDADIRSGFDFAAIAERDYRSANRALRAEWAFWRVTAPKYGFGRTELLPVRSTAEGIARYVGGYIRKHVNQREERDKGRRLVTFIGFRQRDNEGNPYSARVASSRFAWTNGNARLWRRKLAAWAAEIGVDSLEELKGLFGHRWAYFLAPAIMATPLRSDEVHPACAEPAALAEYRRRLEDARSRLTGGKVYQLRNDIGGGEHRGAPRRRGAPVLSPSLSFKNNCTEPPPETSSDHQQRTGFLLIDADMTKTKQKGDNQ